MATLKYADRVKETSTTTGAVDPYVLAGAVAGFQTFAAIGDTNTCGYCATDDTDWEIGIGTYALGTTELTRTTILASSNAGAAVNWGAGTRTVFCTLPGNMIPLLNNTDANTASGNYSVVSGGKSNTASSAGSVICGGYYNSIGTGSLASFIGSGNNNGNTIGNSSNYAVIISGDNNSIGDNSDSSFIGTGWTNAIANDSKYSVIAGGNSNTVSGNGSVVSGGYVNTASGNYSTVSGGYQATTRGLDGMSAIASGKFSAQGDAQEGGYRLRKQTTDATANVALTANAGAQSATNQVILPNASTYVVRGIVVAREPATGDSKTWDFTAGIRRGANAAATAMIAACTPTVVAADAGANTWALDVSADTTNGGLQVRATGEAAHTIQWTASIWTSENVG